MQAFTDIRSLAIPQVFPHSYFASSDAIGVWVAENREHRRNQPLASAQSDASVVGWGEHPIALPAVQA
jgi:hypothetical protein